MAEAVPEAQVPAETTEETVIPPSTEICRRFFMRGRCRFGDNCRYRHVETERGTCLPFYESGTCEAGADCKWLHPGQPTQFQALEEKRAKERAEREEGRKRAEAERAERGETGEERPPRRRRRRGPRDQTTEETTESPEAPREERLPGGAVKDPETGKLICRFFRNNNGECKWGDDCKFDHVLGEPIELPPRRRRTRRPRRRRLPFAEVDGQEICVHFRNKGSCRFGDECKYVHDEGEQLVAEYREPMEPREPQQSRQRPVPEPESSEPREPRTPGGAVKDPETGDLICMFFRNFGGECKFGEDCKFSHVAGEPIEVPRRRRRPRPRRRREPREEGGAPGFPGICHQWADNGECEYGEECRYRHGEEDPRDFGTLREVARTKRGVCYRFRDDNDCRFGESCRFSHDLSIAQTAETTETTEE